MKNINPRTVEKTASFLKELYDTLKKGDTVRITELIHKHHLTTRVSPAMQRLHIVEKMHRGKRNSTPIWKVGEPNLKMAANVVAGCQQIKKSEGKVQQNSDNRILNSDYEIRIAHLEKKMKIIEGFFKNEPKQKKHFKFQFPIIFRKPIIKKP